LWVFGILFGLFFSLIIPLSLMPLLLPMLTEPGISREPTFAPGYIVALLLFFVAMLPLSVITQTSITLGVIDAEQNREHLSLKELIKRGLPFFWRVLGLMLLFTVSMMLLTFTVQALVILLSIVTFGLGVICAAPLVLLTYPIIFVATVLMEQSMNAIIIDHLRVSEAIQRGWHLLRNNLLSIGLMLLVLYFGVGMVTAIGMLPAMFPLFVIPIGFTEVEGSRTLLTIALLSEVVFFPLFILVFGWSMVFNKAAWVLTYLRLTRGPGSQSLSAEATA
jgi:hypothetical protein